LRRYVRWLCRFNPADRWLPNCEGKRAAERTPHGALSAPAELGREGERRAAQFLRKAGYKILRQNYRPFNGGEVDLVCRARHAPELIFVEVKTRSSEEYGAPADAVDWAKQRRIVEAAREWYSLLEYNNRHDSRSGTRKPQKVTVRFDVIEVLCSAAGWEIRHWKDAFTGEETRHPGSQPLIPGATRGDALPRHAHAGGAPFRRRRARD
jgi:putative endonuclease